MNIFSRFYKSIFSKQELIYTSDLSLDEFKSRLDRVFHKDSPFPEKYNLRFTYIGANTFEVEPIVEMQYSYNSLVTGSLVFCRGELSEAGNTATMALSLSTSFFTRLLIILIVIFAFAVGIGINIQEHNWPAMFLCFGGGTVSALCLAYVAKQYVDEIKDGMNKAFILIGKIN